VYNTRPKEKAMINLIKPTALIITRIVRARPDKTGKVIFKTIRSKPVQWLAVKWWKVIH